MDEDDFECELYQLAIHEAGHAAAAWYSGLEVENVSISGDSESDGRTVIVAPPRLRSYKNVAPVLRRCRSVEARIRICFAGPLAEGRFAGETLRILAANNDFTQGVLLLRDLADTHVERERIGDYLVKETQKLIRRRWREIDLLASALIANGDLNSAEIEAKLGPPRWEFLCRKSVAADL